MQAGRNKQTIIVISVSAIIILILSGLFYYFAVKTPISAPQSYNVPQVNVMPPIEEPQPEIIPTEVIAFAVPQTLPAKQETGSCFSNSVAYPYRQDAFRCMIGNSIYDPCFVTTQKSIMFCQPNPLKETFLAIKLTKVLPKAEVPPVVQDNWAWFLRLKDGTECSPFTGTRPFFGTGAEQKIAYYGCVSANLDEQIVLLGDLTKNEVWTAEKAILSKDGKTIKSTQVADIETVWQ